MLRLFLIHADRKNQMTSSSLLVKFHYQVVRVMLCRYVQQYEPNNPRTFKGNDLTRMTMKELFDSYGLDVQTIDFVGHAIALHRQGTATFSQTCILCSS